MLGQEGYDHIGLVNCAGGLMAQDPEMFEIQTPNLLLHHEYTPETAGRGRWRGGMGVRTQIRLGADATRVVVFGDGLTEQTRAFGLAGGGKGSLNSLHLDLPGGERLVPNSLDLLEGLPAGTVLTQVAGGGGGYGVAGCGANGSVTTDIAHGNPPGW